MEKTLPSLLILLFVGCSTRVEVSTERPVSSHPAATEKSFTKVAVDLLPHGQVDFPPRPQSPAPTEAKPPEVEVVGTANSASLPDMEQTIPGKLVEVAGNQNVVITVAGDLHVEQHYHTTVKIEMPRQSGSAHKPARTEVQSLRIDPRCKRLLEVHGRRVSGWKRLFPKLD